MHRMPFGCELTEVGARFRLFAPAVQEVQLELEGSRPIPMQPCDNGWFEHTAAAAGPGSRYHFVLPDGPGAKPCCTSCTSERFLPQAPSAARSRSSIIWSASASPASS